MLIVVIFLFAVSGLVWFINTLVVMVRIILSRKERAKRRWEKELKQAFPPLLAAVGAAAFGELLASGAFLLMAVPSLLSTWRIYRHRQRILSSWR